MDFGTQKKKEKDKQQQKTFAVYLNFKKMM